MNFILLIQETMKINVIKRVIYLKMFIIITLKKLMNYAIKHVEHALWEVIFQKIIA